MSLISATVLADAIKMHLGMSFGEKENVCDAIFKEQPALLASVLVLPRMGVAAKYVDAILNALLVIHLALTGSDSRLKMITEYDQEQELKRFVETVKFSDGLDQHLMNESIKQYIGYRKEPLLMAYIISVLESTGIHADTEESTKYALMVAFNLIGCIANAQSQT